MVSFARYQAPAVVLLVLGLSIGMPAVGQAYTTMQSEEAYRYAGSQIDASEVPADVSPTPFAELSPTAQEIFLTVHDRGDDYTTTKQASDFQYNDDDVAMDGYNYIQYEGEYYQVYAAVQTGSDLGALLSLTGGLAGAFILVGLGLVTLVFDLVTFPSGVVSGVVVTGLGLQIAGMTPVVVGSGIAAMVLTWVVLILVDRHFQITIKPRSESH